MSALSGVAASVYGRINAAHPRDLDSLAQAVWRHWGNGDFGDQEANYLASAIERRREPTRGKRATAAYRPRQRPRSPDRKASRDRRRRLGGSSALPDTLRHHYTEGQRAVLCIVAGEVKHHGVCDLPIDKIAALAGCGRTTVQTALHLASIGLRHIKVTRRPRRGQKSLTNLVEITSPEWLTWIKRGPSAHKPDRVQNTKKVNPTKSILKDEERAIREAIGLAGEIAKVAGYDDATLPPWWSNPHAAVLVDGWRKDLAAVGIGSRWLPSVCKWVMGRKPDREPPLSIAYFEPEVRRLIERQEAANRRVRAYAR